MRTAIFIDISASFRYSGAFPMAIAQIKTYLRVLDEDELRIFAFSENCRKISRADVFELENLSISAQETVWKLFGYGTSFSEVESVIRELCNGIFVKTVIFSDFVFNEQ